MDLNFSAIWERIADEQAERVAIRCGKKTCSWGDYEARAARLAQHFKHVGLAPDSKVAIYLRNSSEYLETQFAAFKLRAVPVNVNYRYQDDELLYLLDNADAEAVVFHASFLPHVLAVRGQLPKVKTWILVEDGSQRRDEAGIETYEDVLQASRPLERIKPRPQDIYMLYTGGTTGMPKGVMYESGPFNEFLVEFLFRDTELEPKSVADLRMAAKGVESQLGAMKALVLCPLMHGTGMWLGCFACHHLGGELHMLDSERFDPEQTWQHVQEHEITSLVLVGDAFARPLLKALDEARSLGRPYNTDSLRRMVSSGTMWSREVKHGLLRHLDIEILDALGGTEAGIGRSVMTRQTMDLDTAQFELSPGVKVFNEAWEEVEPGSGERGLVAASLITPLGYYKDPEKSAKTFIEVKGVRYSVLGDWATVEADGRITLLGRGSQCINTGGEKVFVEEVEEALKRHPHVVDCLVVGIADERFGNRVAAVVECSEEGADCDVEDLMQHVREALADFKAPRTLCKVDQVKRAPNGKADYRWAKEVAQASRQ